MPDSSDNWKVINGWKYPYRINREGIIQRKYETAWKPISPFLSSTVARVTLYDTSGKAKHVPVVHLMADNFMGGRKPGTCIIHKNGSKRDNSLLNLQVVERKQCCAISGRQKRRPVAKLDRSGNEVAVYKSVKEAALHNFVSQESIRIRCIGSVKKPFALCGYDFRYEE